MATQWTGVIAQYVAEQTEGIRHRTNTSSSFELCVAAASRLGRPLTIQCEHTDEEGNFQGARMEVPEELTDTDADVAAAALAATDTTAQAAQEAMWKCEHMVSHTLAKYSGANFFKHGGKVCYHPQCQKALELARMLISRGPSRSFTVTAKSSPLSTSMVSAVTHVRRPLPAEVPPDTRILRLLDVCVWVGRLPQPATLRARARSLLATYWHACAQRRRHLEW